MDGADSTTSLTLLERLSQSPADQAAWVTFVDRYGPKIYGWCRHWGVQDADAADVTQDVLLKLASRLRTFRFDPSGSFRGWLWTVAQHAWVDCRDDWRRAGRGVGAGGEDAALAAVEARDDLIGRLREQFDQELLEKAMARVQERVAPRTWDAYRLTALERLSGAEVADRLDMKVARVFVAKSEVRRLITEEIRRLEGEG
jgi:RNA polymerase sigma-70 factor (ECF subfamily)